MNDGPWRVSWVVAGLILVSAGGALGQDRVTGTVIALVNERCGMKPGLCEGSVAVGEPGHARTLRVKAGRTFIKKEGKPILLEQVRLGDQVSVELVDQPDMDVAKIIEVTSSEHSAPPTDHHSSPDH
jgi:hypothetical protein